MRLRCPVNNEKVIKPTRVVLRRFCRASHRFEYQAYRGDLGGSFGNGALRGASGLKLEASVMCHCVNTPAGVEAGEQTTVTTAA